MAPLFHCFALLRFAPLSDVYIANPLIHVPGRRLSFTTHSRTQKMSAERGPSEVNVRLDECPAAIC
jgi:hypothetical protein